MRNFLEAKAAEVTVGGIAKGIVWFLQPAHKSSQSNHVFIDWLSLELLIGGFFRYDP